MQTMSYSGALCAGPADVSDSTEVENEPPKAKGDSRAVLLDYLHENSMYLAGILEQIKGRWGAFGLATRLSCVDVLRMLEETMLVTVFEEEEDSEDDYEFDDTFGNTVVCEKNIFL